MAKLYDGEGNEIEAFTPEEVEEKQAEVLAERDEEYNEQSQAREDEFKQELEETKTELEKEQNKEKNFGNLRKKNEELTDEQKKAEEENKSKISELEEKVNSIKDEGKSFVVSSFRDDAISEFADDDPELAEKIKENYKLIGKPEGNKEEIKERVKDAYLISVGVDSNDLLSDSTNPPAGPGRSVAGGGSADVSQDTKDIGKKFGISDKDWDEFGGKKN